MKVRIVIEPDEDVYVAYCPELLGCVTYGKTEEEARKNIMEAIELYLRRSTLKRNNLLRASDNCSGLIFKRPFIFPTTITDKTGFSGVAY
jgi:predicted RNase H-like HicB family nuclease